MAKTVQIRNLDDATYEKLRARAEASGISLTQYIRAELQQLAKLPTMADWLADTDRWRAKYGGVSREAMDEAIADMRAERDARVDDRLRD